MKAGPGGKEYLDDMGPQHRFMEWVDEDGRDRFPKEPLGEESTELWENDLAPEYEYSYSILTNVVEEMCLIADKVGRSNRDCEE